MGTEYFSQLKQITVYEMNLERIKSILGNPMFNSEEKNAEIEKLVNYTNLRISEVKAEFETN